MPLSSNQPMLSTRWWSIASTTFRDHPLGECANSTQHHHHHQTLQLRSIPFVFFFFFFFFFFLHRVFASPNLARFSPNRSIRFLCLLLFWLRRFLPSPPPSIQCLCVCAQLNLEGYICLCVCYLATQTRLEPHNSDKPIFASSTMIHCRQLSDISFRKRAHWEQWANLLII